MKSGSNLFILTLLMGSLALANCLGLEPDQEDNEGRLELTDSYSLSEPAAGPEARFIYFNASSTATSLTLLGALILLGVAFYLVYIGGLLAPLATNKSSYSYSSKNDYYTEYDPYSQYKARSNDAYEYPNFNVLEWISVLQEMYENFDLNDLECQKRLICEVVDGEDVFGRVARNMKTGFKYAKYLEMFNLPDDFREVLDEYMDASDRADGQKECGEFFQCPYSIKDSMTRNLSNSL